MEKTPFYVTNSGPPSLLQLVVSYTVHKCTRREKKRRHNGNIRERKEGGGGSIGGVRLFTTKQRFHSERRNPDILEGRWVVKGGASMFSSFLRIIWYTCVCVLYCIKPLYSQTEKLPNLFVWNKTREQKKLKVLHPK